jgi:hypothetical protein
MAVTTDVDLYRRGVETLLACWSLYARGSAGARIHRANGVAAAVFPSAPERGIYNNAVLERDLVAAERIRAIDDLEDAYATAGVSAYRAWVYETETGLRDELSTRRYVLAESTLAMGIRLDEVRVPRPALDLVTIGWPDYVRLFGLPEGLLAGADHSALDLRVVRLGGEPVASALAFDHAGDRGVFNVTTLEHARRRGLGTAVTALLVHELLEAGLQTASLQSTPMAERVYASIGFRDLGRILEYAPPSTEA